MHQQDVNRLINTWGFVGLNMAVNNVWHGILRNNNQLLSFQNILAIQAIRDL